jgi:hypothetical protein
VPRRDDRPIFPLSAGRIFGGEVRTLESVRDATAPAQANHGRHPQTRPDTFMPTPERLIELTHQETVITCW